MCINVIKNPLLLLIGIALSFPACTTNQSTLEIDFSADSSKIVISNIDQASVRYLRNNLKTDTAYQQLVSVLQSPGEEDSSGREIEWPGKLTTQNDQLVFTPDTPFKKGKNYLVETLIDIQFGSAKDIIRAEVGHKVKKTQKRLLR